MKAITGGKVFYQGKFWDGMVLIYDQTIHEVLTQAEFENYVVEHHLVEIKDVQGNYVVPGFIDVHIHGYKDIDVMDGEESRLLELSTMITENGVTAYLPTTMTMSMEEIEQALSVIEQVRQREDVYGAMVLGAHMEGPFINDKYKGAQNGKHICSPKTEVIERFKDTLKVVTIAPEITGAMDTIETYGHEICFSLGHTGATYQEASEAFCKGASSATHLFNAMTGLHHREPGVVGAALTCDCYTELIADDFHVNPSLYRFLSKSKGLDRLMLITDCMRAGGPGRWGLQLRGTRCHSGWGPVPSWRWYHCRQRS